jgi:DNA-binding transcriptional MerR regulator
MDALTIRETAARTGLSPHTLRYYEREALIPAVARTSAGHRRYGTDDLAWIDYVSCLRNVGFGIAEIRTYARLYQQGDGTREERSLLLAMHAERMRSRIAELSRHVREIEGKIKAYRRVRRMSRPGPLRRQEVDGSRGPSIAARASSGVLGRERPQQR